MPSMKYPTGIFLIALIVCSSAITINHEVENHEVSDFACCPSTFVFDEATLSCVCPTTAPYINTHGVCISCAAPNHWDDTSKTCISCPKLQTYDLNVKQCICISKL